ncbi:MAG: hypothetical protein AB7T63_05095 [Planctomycetota bacterium]
MSVRREHRETDAARRTFPYESRLECARAHVAGLEATLARLRRDAARLGAEATREGLRRLLPRLRSTKDEVAAARQELGWHSLISAIVPLHWPVRLFELWGLKSAERRLARCVRSMRALRARGAEGRT